MNKYGAKACWHNSPTLGRHRHDSLAERDFCFVLEQRQAAGEIRGLALRPQYDLTVNGVHIGRYTPDWLYVEAATGQTVVADYKGAASRDYGLRKRLLKACHGLDVVEVRRA